MLFCRKLYFGAVVVLALTGCGDKDSSVVAPPPAPSKSSSEVVATVSPSLMPPPTAVPAPPTTAGTPVATAARNANEVIVPGSKNDPNVIPEGFVPKPPALQYTVNGQPNLEALSQALQVYCMWKKAVPSDLQELVSNKYMAELPPLPAGKKYVINADNLTVGIGN